MDNDELGALRCLIYVSDLFTILEREENRNIRGKTLQAQERSTAETLLHEISHLAWFQW